MTCCIGKARIYFKEPINYWLTYLYNGSIGSVTAPEPLTTECELDNIGDGRIFIAVVTYTARNYTYSPSWQGYSASYTETINLTGLTPLNVYSSVNNPAQAPNISIDIVVFEWQNSVNVIGGQAGNWIGVNVDSYSYYLVGQDKYRFKVIGAETGTEYANIGGLEECPTVISNICLMGEERYVDVEMGVGLPLLPSFIPDCLIAVTGFPLPENTIEIRKITVKPLATNPFKPVKLPQKVLTLTGLPGCPAEYRIECCPDGECEPPERCPPDTDCSLDCNGLVCCYKNGKVIKSFRK